MQPVYLFSSSHYVYAIAINTSENCALIFSEPNKQHLRHRLTLLMVQLTVKLQDIENVSFTQKQVRVLDTVCNF